MFPSAVLVPCEDKCLLREGRIHLWPLKKHIFVTQTLTAAECLIGDKPGPCISGHMTLVISSLTCGCCQRLTSYKHGSVYSQRSGSALSLMWSAFILKLLSGSAVPAGRSDFSQSSWFSRLFETRNRKIKTSRPSAGSSFCSLHMNIQTITKETQRKRTKQKHNRIKPSWIYLSDN